MSTFFSQFPLMLNDLVKGTNIRKEYAFFKRTTSWTSFQVKDYQIARLKKLLQHANDNSAYYSSLFKTIDFNVEDITSIEELKKIPCLTRADIVNNVDTILSRSRVGKISRSSSSGTTGIPLTYYHDNISNSAGIGAGYLIWNLSGWNFGDRSIHIWGNPNSTKKWDKKTSVIKRILFNQVFIPSNLLNDPESIKLVVQIIIQKKPHTVDGYTSSIVNLANYIRENGIEFPRVKAVFTTAENLMGSEKELIESTIGPVSDTYGCGEINSIAVKPVGVNKFYTIDPHVIVETEDIEGSDLKSIVVTDLDNYSFPFIRYKIGDLISDISDSQVGDSLPFRSFSKIHGRTNEIITLPQGKKIHPINMFGGTLFRQLGGIAKHKVVWEGKSFTFIFETKEGYNKPDVESAISGLLQPYNVTFTIEEVDNIPRSKSGKYIYFENRANENPNA